jgi:predicted Zn-dependent protease
VTATPMDNCNGLERAYLNSSRHSPRRKWAVLAGLALTFVALSGCMRGGPERQGGPAGREGPGRRRQSLALTPAQELSLGRQAYDEVIGKAKREGKLLPPGHPDVKKVLRVGARIREAAMIEPLQREINLSVRNYEFVWMFNVIDDPQVNAFCLPAGYVAVYTGLLRVVQTDDELAAVLGHEVGHALAHHASERLARTGKFNRALEAVGGAMGTMDSPTRKRLIGLLAGGAVLYTKSYDRQQESEADHIGIFLMTFAHYDPDQAVGFWQKMRQMSAGRPQPPAILSTHPSDAQRIQQIQKWVPYAKAALQAYRSGNIVK